MRELEIIMAASIKDIGSIRSLEVNLKNACTSGVDIGRSILLKTRFLKLSMFVTRILIFFVVR